MLIKLPTKFGEPRPKHSLVTDWKPLGLSANGPTDNCKTIYPLFIEGGHKKKKLLHFVSFNFQFLQETIGFQMCKLIGILTGHIMKQVSLWHKSWYELGQIYHQLCSKLNVAAIYLSCFTTCATSKSPYKPKQITVVVITTCMLWFNMSIPMGHSGVKNWKYMKTYHQIQENNPQGESAWFFPLEDPSC